MKGAIRMMETDAKMSRDPQIQKLAAILKQTGGTKGIKLTSPSLGDCSDLLMEASDRELVGIEFVTNDGVKHSIIVI